MIKLYRAKLVNDITPTRFNNNNNITKYLDIF